MTASTERGLIGRENQRDPGVGVGLPFASTERGLIGRENRDRMPALCTFVELQRSAA